MDSFFCFINVFTTAPLGRILTISICLSALLKRDSPLNYKCCGKINHFVHACWSVSIERFSHGEDSLEEGRTLAWLLQDARNQAPFSCWDPAPGGTYTGEQAGGERAWWLDMNALGQMKSVCNRFVESCLYTSRTWCQ